MNQPNLGQEYDVLSAIHSSQKIYNPRSRDRKQSVGEEFISRHQFHSEVPAPNEARLIITPIRLELNDSLKRLSHGQSHAFHPYIASQDSLNPLKRQLTKSLTQLVSQLEERISETSNNHPDFLQKVANFVFLESQKHKPGSSRHQIRQNIIPVLDFEQKYRSLVSSLGKILQTHQSQQSQEKFDELVIYKLCTTMLQFWMNAFLSMKTEVQKHTEPFTLMLFKEFQNQQTIKNPHYMSAFNIHKQPEPIFFADQDQVNHSSATSKRRRPWSNEQIQKLQKLITSKREIDDKSLGGLAVSLDRTIPSIQTKLHRLFRKSKHQTSNKSVGNDESCLQKKICTVLQPGTIGLTKQQILLKLEEQFEMGKDSTWRKSASQILSGSKHILKVKGEFVLKQSYLEHNAQQDKMSSNNNTRQTLKSKLLQILKELPQHKGNLRTITQHYCDRQDIQYTREQECQINKILVKCKKEVVRTKNTYRYSAEPAIRTTRLNNGHSSEELGSDSDNNDSISYEQRQHSQNASISHSEQN